MSKVTNRVRCSVEGCEKESLRSLNIEKVISAGLKVESVKRARLCKEHYKKFKKATKKDRILEKWRYGSNKGRSSYSTKLPK